jgi:xylulose-5-phosphate/fructose-6-phosphate phosphoketolase
MCQEASFMIESVLENPTETAVTGSTTRNAAASQAEGPLSSELLARINAYWRAANYLSVGQIYLYDNPLLKEPLKLSHVKPLARTSSMCI